MKNYDHVIKNKMLSSDLIKLYDFVSKGVD